MRIWGYTQDQRYMVTANTIQKELTDIERNITNCDGGVLANNLLWICASSDSILANLAAGNMRDSVGKLMDQGAAFEDLVHLEADILGIAKVIQAGLRAGVIQGCVQGRFVQFNRTWYCLYECTEALSHTANKMNAFFFPPVKLLTFPNW